MPDSFAPILLSDSSAAKTLGITLEELDWLVASRQLSPITICGNRRFLYENLRTLARVYQTTQERA